MDAAQQQLVEFAVGRFGPRAALTDPADIAPWLTDWRGRWTGQSGAILQPGSSDEAQAILARAAELGVRLTFQGGNTSMVGGATPPADGSSLLLSTRRLNRIRDIAPGHALVEAGVILETLHDAAAADGQRFPLTLGAKGSATIGGLISTNAGGTQVLRFGTMGGLVEGIEAILPDGTMLSTLQGLKKDNRGPRIDRLLGGAEGTLGLVTAARLKLVPAVRDRTVAWLGLGSPAAALSVLQALQAATDRVEGFEIVPRESLDAALQEIAGTRNPLAGAHPWHALVELTGEGAGEEPGSALVERLLGPLVEQGLIADAAVAANEAQADAFWHLRHSLSEAEKKAYGPATQHDLSVPVDAMPRFLDEAAKAVEAAFPGVRASGFGHLGDGNIHFHVRAMGRGGADWVAREGPAITRLVDDLVTAAGGSISAEHGIGRMKREELERLDPQRVAALRALKASFDPAGRMNPGVLV